MGYASVQTQNLWFGAAQVSSLIDPVPEQNGGSRASRNSKAATQRDEGAGLTLLDNPGLVTFPALRKIRVRAIAPLNQAEDRAAPPAAQRHGEPPGTRAARLPERRRRNRLDADRRAPAMVDA